ncbi:unnamed protein product [Echinostoma caproni]|uniref:SH3 domain-containing protein n=1 Tax=Echinostoma caproni TaxID=27848 RepID=A0A183B5Z4_9TREM|nr:unnamed protein product [Echinostoma caproni]
MRARVIYDFSAQAEGELSVAAGEEVTITDQSVGAGWWRAQNDFGRDGLVPSSFVEPLDIPEPNIPPPPPPQFPSYSDTPAAQDWDDDWDSDESDHGSMSARETGSLTVKDNYLVGLKANTCKGFMLSFIILLMQANPTSWK